MVAAITLWTPGLLTAEGGHLLPKTQNTLLNIMIRRKVAICAQDNEHANISMYFSTCATCMGN